MLAPMPPRWPSCAFDLVAQLGGVDQVAVVAERDAAARRGGAERGLGVLPGGGPGGGVAAVADGDVALQRAQHLLVEDLADQAEVLVDDGAPPVGHGHARRLLPPVLEGVEAVVGEVGDVLARGPDAEDATLFGGTGSGSGGFSSGSELGRTTRSSTAPAGQAPHRTPHQLRNPFTGTRVTKPASLAQVARQGGQPIRLDAGLHPFGRHLQPEGVRHSDERADDRRVGRVGVGVAEAVDERAVDLQRVHGEAAQPGQAGPAGAEVVQREPHARRPQRREAFGDRGAVAEHGLLGDLQLELAGREAFGAQRRDDVGDPARLAQLHRRDVHADERRVLPQLAPPPGGLRARGGEHPAAELHDRAALLGEPDEAAGPDQPLLGVLPAHEGLGAAHAAVGQRDQRLVDAAGTRRSRCPSGRPATSA